MKKKIIVVLLLLLLPCPTVRMLHFFFTESDLDLIVYLVEQHPVIVCLIIGVSGIIAFAYEAASLFLFYKLVTVISGWKNLKKRRVI